jgi:hypothetical protein
MAPLDRKVILAYRVFRGYRAQQAIPDHRESKDGKGYRALLVGPVLQEPLVSQAGQG